METPTGKLRILRYVPLLAAGVLVFVGLLMLEGLLGVLRLPLIEVPFGRWIRSSPPIAVPVADWFVWSASFLLSVSPGILVLARTKGKPDPVMVFTSLVFPLLALVAMTSLSRFVGAMLFVGSGFLAAYGLVSKSRRLLGVETSFALRLVCTEVFGFLAVVAAGGVVSVLLQRGDVFLVMISGSNSTLMEPWLSMLAVDLGLFYLARPLLSAIFVTLAVAAIGALFMEPFQWIARSLSLILMKGKRSRRNHPCSAHEQRMNIVARGRGPYLVLAGCLALAIAMTLYPYTDPEFARSDWMHWRALGADYYWYLEKLRSTTQVAEAVGLLQGDRGLFLLVLFLIRTVTGLSAEWVLRLTPALLSVLLALSSFMLVKEGTGRLWVAAFSALLSVVSAQTALGMYTGIVANWFALSIANFAFALIVRSIRLHSRRAAIGSVAVLLVLLSCYGYLWLVVIGELILALVASIAAFRAANRRELRYDMSLLGGILFGSLLAPAAFVLLASIAFGFRPLGVDPGFWFATGWNYVARGATLEVLGSALTALEGAFGFAGNRIGLPFLTLLSIVGLLDHTSQAPSFRRIMSATVLLPSVIAMITPGLYFTWRGLYIIPMYVMGALGAESIVRRVNGQESPRRSRSRLAFAGTFAVYVFLSQLGYLLRSLELLIMVASTQPA